MYLVREVFKSKPGKAKELVKKFKAAAPHFEKSGEGTNYKVLTDAVGSYWAVVVEFETADMGNFFSHLRNSPPSAELQEIMKGYIDLVEGGSREIYLIE